MYNMSKNSIFLVVGGTTDYREAEKMRDVFEKKLDVKFKCHDLEDIGTSVNSSKFKSAASRAQAILFFCSEDFKSHLDQCEPVSFDADGTRITLEKNAIYESLDDRKIKDKFILLSYDTPIQIPNKLRDKGEDDIFILRRNMQGKELIDAMRPIAFRAQRK